MTEIEEKLFKQYDDSNDLLKFAEAKNVGLIAFNVGVIIGMTTLLVDFKDDGWIYIIVFGYIMVLNLISIIIAFMSIVPQIKHKASDLKTYKTDNLLFFGQIASTKPDEYLQAFVNRYAIKSEHPAYEQDLARQTVIVSQIALRKMNYFKVACLITLTGIGTPLALIAYLIFSDPNK